MKFSKPKVPLRGVQRVANGLTWLLAFAHCSTPRKLIARCLRCAGPCQSRSRSIRILKIEETRDRTRISPNEAEYADICAPERPRAFELASLTMWAFSQVPHISHRDKTDWLAAFELRRRARPIVRFAYLRMPVNSLAKSVGQDLIPKLLEKRTHRGPWDR